MFNLFLLISFFLIAYSKTNDAVSALDIEKYLGRWYQVYGDNFDRLFQLNGRCVYADYKLVDENLFEFCWIVDFPMYEKDEENGKIQFSHNPFSMPQGGMKALEEKDPLDIKAFQYDIVCNGIELSSGAIRNHDLDIMLKAFNIAGYNQKDIESKFPSLYNAFKYGAPPHGGIAPGIDRIVMLIANEPNIREVIMFPMNQKAEDLLMSAPNIVDDKQLKELGIDIIKEE